MPARCYRLLVFFVFVFYVPISCKNNTTSAGKKMEHSDSASENKIRSVFHKPPGSFHDTLTIRTPAAIFYNPDSLQLEKIKEQTDNAAFNASNNEYVHMMENARMVIEKAWPGLKIIESKHYRYLLFIRRDDSLEFIDLDKYDDIYGLFVFDGKRSPLLVDMMNVETQVSSYLNP